MDLRFERSERSRRCNVVFNDIHASYVIGYVDDMNEKFHILNGVFLSGDDLECVISYMRNINACASGCRLVFLYNKHWQEYDVARNYVDIGTVNLGGKFFSSSKGVGLAVSELQEIVDFINSHSEISWKRVGF